jgi:CubicO group peptidase (beta-lactamase class C family)
MMLRGDGMSPVTKTRAALAAAAILLFGLTGSARPFDSAQGRQAPAGFDFEPLEKVAAEELRKTGAPGGAIAIVLGDRVIYTSGFGVASVETNEPVRPEMLFRLGSTTKMFTAAALVTLAERGALDLNAPVGSYVNGLNAKIARVTADHLLSHRSGLFDEAPMMGSHDETALEKEVRAWTESRFFTEPGQVFSYSNPGYWFAGFLIEHASNRKYADQLEESLFGPLGMKSTTLRPLVAMTFPLAQGHEETPQGPRVIRPAANNAASWPAGSIFSNVLDLSRFVIAFLNDGRIDGRQVLSPAVIRSLSTPRAKIPGGDVSYGYGVQLAKSRGVDMVSHGGSRAGYGSSIRMVPSKKFGVITVANRTGIGLGATAEKAIEIALSLEPATTTANAPSALTATEMNAYAGTYSQGPRTIEVLVRDGKLLLKQNNRERPLVKFGDDDFRANGGPRYVFVRNASGAIEYLHSGSRSWRKVR